MGANQAREIDAWLRDGGIVVAASDRAARAIASAYHRARLEEGKRAWAAPEILSWQHFASREWERRTNDGRLVLNTLQEQAIWTEIVAAGGHAATTLEAGRQRLAAMAMNAHALLCSYAVSLLDRNRRRGWSGDAAAFGDWLENFDAACQSAHAVSEARVPLELTTMLRDEAGARSPLLLAAFDRLQPVQQDLFEDWGNWRQVAEGKPAEPTRFYEARDREAELTACALWCKGRLAENPEAKLLVVTQDLATRRGVMERAFLEHGNGSRQFEFSLGVPLVEIGVARSAVMLLRWLDGMLQEHELDWLLSTGFAVAAQTEGDPLQARMRELRRRNKQRTRWTLNTFLQQSAKPAIPEGWMRRMRGAQQQLQSTARRDRSPLEWAELAPRLLAETGWPGERRVSGAEFQAMRRLQEAVELCGSLGFHGRQISWKDYLAELERVVQDTLFSTESQDAPIMIAGPSESAGLSADAIWFLGASEDAWPAKGNLHPLLPPDVQRKAQMPHASPQLDWEAGRAVTSRLLHTAPKMFFSYPRQTEGVDARPSRLVAQFAGLPEPIPAELSPPAGPAPRTIRYEDEFAIPLRRVSDAEDTSAVRGGATLLKTQSQCAFRAFATNRLGAEEWQPAEVGLSAAVRGQLLHSVMHAIWGGPPHGIRSWEELHRIPDRPAFVAERVEEVMRNEVPDVARELPPRYLALEAKRLTRLVANWLDYEAARLPFAVTATELKSVVNVGGLKLDLRLDRIDRLNDGSLLVVDYKTGDISPRVWDTPRPEDVQLPLYGGFALEPGSELGGLVFAKIRAGDASFAGRVGDASATLGAGLPNAAALAKYPLSAEQLMDWRSEILRLTRDYLEGRADVDPIDTKTTCNWCGLQSLCRIHEKPVLATEEQEEEMEADE
jgi:probable DNA repair protein